MADLTWVGPISTGRSHMTYFGSTPTEKEVVVVIPVPSPKNGVPAWQIVFIDGSCRTPFAPIHPSREAAFAHASREAAFAHAVIELKQPISERGRRSRRLNAFMFTKARFPRYEALPDSDLFAACGFIAGTLDGVTATDIYSQFGRDRAAA